MSRDQGFYVFEVKEREPGDTAWIHCQPTKPQLSIVGAGSLTIHVENGTPDARVRELASLLNELGASVVFWPPR